MFNRQIKQAHQYDIMLRILFSKKPCVHISKNSFLVPNQYWPDNLNVVNLYGYFVFTTCLECDTVTKFYTIFGCFVIKLFYKFIQLLRDLVILLNIAQVYLLLEGYSDFIYSYKYIVLLLNLAFIVYVMVLGIPLIKVFISKFNNYIIPYTLCAGLNGYCYFIRRFLLILSFIENRLLKTPCDHMSENIFLKSDQGWLVNLQVVSLYGYSIFMECSNCSRVSKFYTILGCFTINFFIKAFKLISLLIIILNILHVCLLFGGYSDLIYEYQIFFMISNCLFITGVFIKSCPFIKRFFFYLYSHITLDILFIVIKVCYYTEIIVSPIARSIVTLFFIMLYNYTYMLIVFYYINIDIFYGILQNTVDWFYCIDWLCSDDDGWFECPLTYYIGEFPFYLGYVFKPVAIVVCLICGICLSPPYAIAAAIEKLFSGYFDWKWDPDWFYLHDMIIDLVVPFCYPAVIITLYAHLIMEFHESVYWRTFYKNPSTVCYFIFYVFLWSWTLYYDFIFLELVFLRIYYMGDL